MIRLVMVEATSSLLNLDHLVFARLEAKERELGVDAAHHMLASKALLTSRHLGTHWYNAIKKI